MAHFSAPAAIRIGAPAEELLQPVAADISASPSISVDRASIEHPHT